MFVKLFFYNLRLIFAEVFDLKLTQFIIKNIYFSEKSIFFKLIFIKSE